MTHLVTKKAVRPAGPQDRCFYCRQIIGTPHDFSCVLLKRKVKVRLTVEYEVDVPAEWDKEQIEFHRNEGSWCANNALDELTALFRSENSPCMCELSHFEVVSLSDEVFSNG